MTTLYNTTELDQAENIIEMAVAVNNISGGFLSWAILFIIYTVSFIALYKTDSKSTALAVSVITLILVLIGFALEFFDEVQFGVAVSTLVVSLILAVWRKN